MGVKFLQVSVVYFVIGIVFGMYMSMAKDYTMTGVHVHINLLGWASFALAGLIYYLFPKAGNNVLAKIHFWAHNIGFSVMMLGLALLLGGNGDMEILVIIGSTITALCVLLFMINVMINVRTASGK